VASLAITPIHAYAGDRAEVEFDASSIEATFGRVDRLGERWTSDVRAVALYDRIEGESEPYAGVRTRQTWRRVTAENPLLMTFEGHEVSGTAEVFAGNETWSRVRIDQRMSRRWGPVRAGESVLAFHGHAVGIEHAFLINEYGYEYAELRLDRGIGANVDLGYAITSAMEFGAHVGWLRSNDVEARGLGVDLTASWKGIGFRFGVGKAREHDDLVLYGSILAARFMR
jgi:hypothetical protein